MITQDVTFSLSVTLLCPHHRFGYQTTDELSHLIPGSRICGNWEPEKFHPLLCPVKPEAVILNTRWRSTFSRWQPSDLKGKYLRFFFWIYSTLFAMIRRNAIV